MLWGFDLAAEEFLDVDELRVDALRYDPAWKTPGVLSAMLSNTVDRIRLAIPLGANFRIYLVLGYDSENMPEFWITLSDRVKDELKQRLGSGIVHELHNKDLWQTLRQNRRARGLSNEPD